jgi:hypothetical protein
VYTEHQQMERRDRMLRTLAVYLGGPELKFRLFQLNFVVFSKSIRQMPGH